MEQEQEASPLQPPARPLKVGIIYNLKKGIKAKAVDAEAEYDNIATVDAIRDALVSHGQQAVKLEAGPDLMDRLRQHPIDIAFNIAEGFFGRGREAQVPALLNIVGVPFTGSDETTLCVALDKALTKRLLGVSHIRTARYTVVTPGHPYSVAGLRFPLIVKPNAEGSSKGISDVSIVTDRRQLDELVAKDEELYDEPLLLEEYIEGREFTVGLLGNDGGIRVFEPMEICYRRPTQDDYHIYSYNVKQNYKQYIDYRCPARLDVKMRDEMMQMARRSFEALNCRDFARVDFRLSDDGRIWFIEINPLPGLAPHYSDYPMLAEFCGMPYDQLVYEILKAGAVRNGLWPRH